jgi:hypothetical protein
MSEKSEINQVRRQAWEDMQADYVTLKVAKLATGMSEKKLLDWCGKHNVRHIKRRAIWLFHQKDLVTALKSGPLPAQTMAPSCQSPATE